MGVCWVLSVEDPGRALAASGSCAHLQLCQPLRLRHERRERHRGMGRGERNRETERKGGAERGSATGMLWDGFRRRERLQRPRAEGLSAPEGCRVRQPEKIGRGRFVPALRWPSRIIVRGRGTGTGKGTDRWARQRNHGRAEGLEDEGETGVRRWIWSRIRMVPLCSSMLTISTVCCPCAAAVKPVMICSEAMSSSC